MSKTKKIIILFIFAFFLIAFDKKIFATSISFSNNQPHVGDSVTITVSVPNVNTCDVHATVTGPGISNQINVVGGDLSGAKKTYSNSITVKPTAAGTISVSVTSGSNAVQDGNYANVGASATVNVTAQTTTNPPAPNNGGTTVTPTPTPANDTNVNLSNLGIRPHDFSGFRAANTTYTVNVPNDCTSINVYATAQSASAIISGTGAKTLKEGSNPFSVTVTNGGNSKTYKINVVRATLEGDIPPNVIDEENPTTEPDENQGIGLSALSILGYELEEEFRTDIYEYTVKMKKEITLEELLRIKESKIVATANSENVSIEMQEEILEDGNGKIIIVVKDTEKEYAKYVITFEIEEKKEESPAILLTNMSNNNSNGTGIFGVPYEFMLWVVLAGYGVTLFSAIYFAVNCYLRDRELDEYYKEDESTEFEKINDFYNGVVDKPETEEKVEVKKATVSKPWLDETEESKTLEPDLPNEEQEENKEENVVGEISSKLRKMSGYRNLRNAGKSTGRHF